LINNVYQFTGFISLKIKEYKNRPQPAQAHQPSIPIYTWQYNRYLTSLYLQKFRQIRLA